MNHTVKIDMFSPSKKMGTHRASGTATYDMGRSYPFIAYVGLISKKWKVTGLMGDPLKGSIQADVIRSLKTKEKELCP